MRTPFTATPQALRDGLQTALGGAVVDVTPTVGGWAPGVACVITLTNTMRVFVKAADTACEYSQAHRAEAHRLTHLPGSVPAPQLHAVIEAAGWIALACQAIDGLTPRWAPGQLDRALASIADCHRLLTPCPVPGVPTLTDDAAHLAVTWADLHASGHHTSHLRGVDLLADSGLYLDDLAALERRTLPASAGNTMIHWDLRADNMIDTTDQMMIVDWSHPLRAAAWVDLLAFLPTIRTDGFDPQPVFRSHPSAVGADPDDVDAVLAGLAGYWCNAGYRPDIASSLGLREHQRACGAAALRWLAHRRS